MLETAIRVPVDEMYRYYQATFTRLGLSDEDTTMMADYLIDSDLHGIDTHGLARVLVYSDRILKGGTKTHTDLQTVQDSGSIVVLDANDGVGQVAATRAMRLVVERAREHGVAVVGVRRSNHLGTLCYYTRMALEAQMIGFAITGVPSTLAPWGGATALLGSNPWGIAIPARRHTPIVLDMANGSIISTDINRSREEGTPLPPGTALDAEGRFTQDGRSAVSIVPIGGHKGFGLTLAWEVLASVLTGAAYSNLITKFEDAANPKRIGHFFLAMRVDRFMPYEEFVDRVDDFIDRLKGSHVGPEQTGVRMPGERAHQYVAERTRDGIPVQPRLARKIAALSQELGVPAPFAAPA